MKTRCRCGCPHTDHRWTHGPHIPGYCVRCDCRRYWPDPTEDA